MSPLLSGGRAMSEHYRLRKQQWGGAYKLAHPDAHQCVYCGAATGGKDHVPPLQLVDQLGGQAGELLLYGCCSICNGKLSAYPANCVQLRAEYLVCNLRAEWLRVRAGIQRKWQLAQIEAAGRGVSARLKAGNHRQVCRCPRCAESDGA